MSGEPIWEDEKEGWTFEAVHPKFSNLILSLYKARRLDET
jgi:hypothetical protein